MPTRNVLRFLYRYVFRLGSSKIPARVSRVISLRSFGIASKLFRDFADVSLLFGRKISFNQFEYLIERDQSPHWFVLKIRALRHQHFVRLFNDGAVASAEMFGSTRLQSNAGHDVDRHLD